jgi:hypothetical protein
VINQNSLPEVSLPVVAATAASIESAINAYYRMNTHRGCTDRDSPNFSFFANVDDGSCEYNLTTTNFGGIFQTCNARNLVDRLLGLQILGADQSD